LSKLLSFQAAARARDSERQAGAALQRQEEMTREETRISAAARADLELDRLPQQPDPMDRDAAK